MIVANLLMAGLSAFFLVSLLLELQRPVAVPAARADLGSMRAALLDEWPSPKKLFEQIETFNVVVARNLFNESRKERTSVSTARAEIPPPPKLILHGVVVDGPSSLAFLEDPVTKHVVVYHVGDRVAGGQLLQVTQDGVGILRPDGQIEILLKDPAKSAPAGQSAGPTPPSVGAPAAPRSPTGPSPRTRPLPSEHQN